MNNQTKHIQRQNMHFSWHVFSFNNNHLEMRNKQTWTEKQKSKHNNQNKTNHVRKQKHALVWYFLFKNNHFQVINQHTWTQNTIVKTKKHVRKQKRALVWYFCCLKTNILKWETNKLELKNKNQNTIIKTKQTVFENKNMLLSDFLFKNNHCQVRT